MNSVSVDVQSSFLMGQLTGIVALCAVLSVLPDTMGRRHSHRSKSEPSKHHKSGGKIVGGEEVDSIGDAPFMASLYLTKGNDSFLCGGTILNDQNILTAAHCLEGMERADVRVGSKYYGQMGTVYQSQRLTPHPLYNKRNYDFDVGIVRLSTAMALDNETTEAIQLPNEMASLQTGDNVTVYGWGLTQEGGSVSQVLQKVTVPVVDRKKCRQAYSTLTRRQFCAGDTTEPKDSCQGDSGGPALDDANLQRGIVSFGSGCARKGFPGAYTDVAKVRKFIRMTAGV